MDKYGLVGYPLKHSFSRGHFTEKFAREKIDAEYVNFEIPSIEDFKGAIENEDHLKGLNVTLPYKEQIIRFLDGLSDGARDIGAVNVIQFIRSNDEVKLIGHNSDIIGFKHSIGPYLKDSHRKALVLGTGGAAKSAFHGLKQLGLSPVYVSRTKSEGVFTYQELNQDLMHEYQVIVNASPVGMSPHIDQCPDIPYDLLGPEHLLFDLIYNPEETLFLKKGKEKGAVVKNGMEMLVLQANAAWKIWNPEK